MGTSITDVIGGPHGFLPSRSDEFQKLCCYYFSCSRTVCLLGTFPKKVITLPGYLPKLKFKYFDTSCTEAYIPDIK